ncbi:EF-hand calcium-binding domain-containing protein 7 isoform X3 [Patella vulgata]|uniref:EF-hand calcium-binding domain-containing protein 7 isoform X3 n=1 Tax=Patella vulgata TaxID=6465 RepID=UPI0024A86B55|nr:EF-hand calcium-binding domain-containing protein 7 isoform X3 [Patella vulgata]
MSRRQSSRPSSAASYSSRSSTLDGELRLECKAAFLCLFDDLSEEITSKEDLISALQQTGRNPTNRSLTKYWTRDTRSLTFDDFVHICKKEPVTTADDLMKAFRKVDLNGDGYISLDELYKLMTTRGERMSKSDVQDIIEEVDENRDGRLDYREFCNMMISTAEDCKKLSLKVMEKKERRKQRRGNADDNRSVTSRRESQLKSVSQVSLRSNKSDKASLSGSRQSLLSIDQGPHDYPKPSPRGKRDLKPAVSSRSSKLSEPRNLREWTHIRSNGCFFLDQEEGIVSHKYQLYLPTASNVWITIHPIKIIESAPVPEFPIDTALFILKNKKLVTFTEQRDSKGKYGVRGDLEAGKYTIIPFSTGCRLKVSNHRNKQEAKLVKTDRDDKVVITKVFRKAIEELFQLSDLDGNGLLSRQEFNMFNLRSSGEEVADDEWNVVEENVELEDGEITKKGFIRLNEMEAEDNGGDAEDLWVTLTSHGFNKNLELDQACPYKIDVYTEECDDVEFKVTGIEPLSDSLNDYVCESVMAKGESSNSRDKRDILLHTYIGETRATVVAENKSRSPVKVNVDCSGSRNCSSNIDTLEPTVTVPANSTAIALHLMPEDERSDWCVKCE